MAHGNVVETPDDRKALVREAGWRSISGTSLVAGVLTAYGAFALIAGLAAAVLDGVGVDTAGLSDADWRQVGLGAGAAAVVALFVAYWFGGYVAGRMARRAGVMHGLLVCVVGIGVLAGAGALIGTSGEADTIVDNLRDLGVPTSGNEWAEIGTGIGIASLLAILLGSLLGGRQGERWHGRLLARALSPEVGPEAVARERFDAESTESQRVRQSASPTAIDLTRAEAETRTSEMPGSTEWVSTADGAEVPVRHHQPTR